MAFATTTHWEVRTTGDNSNGGGFDVASSGTDYSQQDSTQVTYSDLVIGTPNSHLTSAAHPFTSDHVGNVINITGGTGFTVQRVQIASIASGVATCDKACGTIGSTGGTGKLGGALATPGGLPALANGGVVWLKSGTYTLSATLAPGNVPWSLFGYTSSHGDNGTATLTTATNSVNLVQLPTGQNFSAANLILTTTATAKAAAFTAPAGANFIVISNCSITGFTTGINASSAHLVVQDTSIVNCSTNAISVNTSLAIIDSYISGSGSIQIVANTAIVIIMCNTIIVDGSSVGAQVNGSGQVAIIDCTVANHSANGFSINGDLSGPFRLQGSIIYGNGQRGIGIATVKSYATFYMSNNAWGANPSGNYPSGIPAGAGDVTLTADPFTASGSGDYSLNSTAGGGGACKNVGFPGAFPGGTTTGNADIGAVQSDTGGGGGSTPSNYSWSA